MTPETPARRRRGRPASPVLTTEAITEAAIQVISSQGYERLTMTTLADQLGVSASAVYNHASSKREVLIWVQDRLNRDIDASGFDDGPWDEALARWAHSYRGRFIENTAMIPIMAVLPVANSPHTLQMYERVISGLTRAGIEDDLALEMIVAVETLAFGAAYDATAPADLFDPGDLAEVAPIFSGAASRRPADPRQAADHAFETALEALLAGFRARLAP